MLLAYQWEVYRNTKQESVYYKGTQVSKIAFLDELQGKDLSSKRCMLVGPLHHEGEGSGLKSNLSSLGFKSEIIKRDVEKAPGYWVYFKMNSLVQSGGEKLKEFKAKGIDSFLINTGRLKGDISLGVFQNIDSARRLEAQMKKKGYEVKTAEIDKGFEEFWLLIPLGDSVGNNYEIAPAIKPLIGGYKKQQIFCKSVASEKQLP